MPLPAHLILKLRQGIEGIEKDGGRRHRKNKKRKKIKEKKAQTGNRGDTERWGTGAQGRKLKGKMNWIVTYV